MLFQRFLFYVLLFLLFVAHKYAIFAENTQIPDGPVLVSLKLTALALISFDTLTTLVPFAIIVELFFFFFDE